MIAEVIQSLKMSIFYCETESYSFTNSDGKNMPPDMPSRKEFAPIEVAANLSFSGNHSAETKAQAFSKKGYPAAMILCPITTHQKLRLIMALSQFPRVVKIIPIERPNFKPFLSSAITAG
jgi:hypothetical protein